MKKIILFTIVAVGLIGSASASVLTGDLTNGLVAYYQLNGNANDSSGNGNNGTVYGATPTTDQFGNPNGAYSFNGVNSYIEGPNIISDFGGPLTLACWTLSTITNNPMTIVSIPQYSGSLNGFGDQIQIYSGLGQGVYWNNYNSTYNVLSTTNTIADGVWHSQILTLDGTNVSYYVDGNMIGEQTYNNNNPLTIAGLQIGRAFVGDPSTAWMGYFNGSISDVGIWNTALTPAQVSSLYGIQSVPEPSTYALFGIGAIGLLMVMRWKKAA